MTLTARDRRALMLLAPAVIVVLGVYWTTGDDSPKVVAPAKTAEPFERRLDRLRQTAATLPSREEALQAVKAENKQREMGLIAAETASQAQAQLLQILRRIARAETPPIEFRGVEIGQVRPAGDYGEAPVSVNVECRIEQLVNFLAQLTAQPEILATSELRVNAGDPKNKTIGVRLTVSGIIPKRLVPEKKGTALF